MPLVSPSRPTSGVEPDDGYFPEGRSMLHRVHGERRVGLMFGQRALTVGAIKPLNYVGTANHSGHKGDPFKRLTRTAIAFETVFFGTRAEADRILAYVERMHGRVHGALAEPAGIHPAGTPYDAFDPALMVWTVAAMMDSAEAMHDLLVRPLSAGEREALWQDYRRFAQLFGTPDEALPTSYPRFRDYFEAELVAADVHLTEQARYVGWFASFAIPSPTLRGPLKDAHDLIVRGSLPPAVRALYGLDWSAADQRRFGRLCRIQRITRKVTPSRLARGANTAVFKGIAAEEARRLKAGRPTPHLRPDGSAGTAHTLSASEGRAGD
ncbi:MAG: oxygenase MpaB family protein [Patulibacter minatonensis]